MLTTGEVKKFILFGVFDQNLYRNISDKEDIFVAVTGEWRRLHNGELNDLYSSPNIVRVIK